VAGVWLLGRRRFFGHGGLGNLGHVASFLGWKPWPTPRWCPKPDAERGAVVKACVVLAPGHAGDAALVEELQQHVRGKLAPYEYPKEIEFIDELPMTSTGKIQRRVLRQREEERAGLSPASAA
jgi:hypothetical protein